MRYKKIIGIAIICVITMSIGTSVVKAETATSAKKILPAIKNSFEKKDIRNNKIERREDVKDIRASTTEMLKKAREERREDIKDIRASTTEMFKKAKEEKREIVKNMRVDVFQIRKNALEKELTKTLEYLTLVREKILARITQAESNGRIMTEAKNALSIADDKLAKAKIAVELFKNTVFVPQTNTTSTSTQLNLDKPRKLGDDAIKAVKEARDSLKKVVTTIAGLLGEKNRQATSTQRVNTQNTSTSSSSI